MKILIFTSEGSGIFTDNMQAYLLKKGHEVVRISLSNLVNVSGSIFIPFELTQEDFSFTYNSVKYSLSDFDLIWKRRFDNNFLNNVLDYNLYKKYPKSVSNYLETEIKALKDAILTNARHRGQRIINDFDPDARDKVCQLKKAKEFGFKIPDFLFTNQKSSIDNFLKNYENIITKPCSNFGYIHDSGKIYSHKTSITRSNDIKKMPQNLFPSFFQKGIYHSHELKCIYIGGKLLAVKQQATNKKNHFDIKSEYKENNVSIENYEVDQLIKEKTKKICDFFNLDLCTIDFLVGKNGDYTFLEINTDGIIAYYSNFIEDNIYETFYNFIING